MRHYIKDENGNLIKTFECDFTPHPDMIIEISGKETKIQSALCAEYQTLIEDEYVTLNCEIKEIKYDAEYGITSLIMKSPIIGIKPDGSAQFVHKLPSGAVENYHSC